MRVTIIGAGLTGACCALALVRGGHEVTLLDAARAGSGTTSNSGSAVLYQSKESELLVEMTRRSMELWEAHALEGIAPFRRDGSHVLFSSAEEDAFAGKRAALLRERGIDVRRLDREATQLHLPQLHPDIAGSYYCAEDAETNPYLSFQGILGAALRGGATLRQEDGCADIALAGGRVRAVRTASGETITSDAVVIAAGHRTAALAERYGAALPVSPERGEQLLTPPMPPTLKGRVLSVSYTRGKTLGAFAGLAVGQEPDGRIKIGSTREPGQSELVTSERGRATLLQELASCFPELATLPIERHTVGVRSASRTGRPIMVELPQCAGLFAIDGLGGNGVTFAPLIAEALASLVAGQPDRFAREFALA